MCGIWAIFGSSDEIVTQSLNAHKISHRGPDAFRIETVQNFPTCCIGFHRLSIIDNARGMQPMRVFEYPHIWLIFNGEIYNYKMLQKEFGFKFETNCDAEVIIHLYAYNGIKFAVKQLDGVFAFCLLDTINRKVYIGRDTFGVKPLFRISNDHGFLAICSEAKGLIGLSGGNNCENIDYLLPGHIETYSVNEVGKAHIEERIQFHQIGDAPAYSSTVETKENGDISTNIRLLFENAVGKRLMAERRIGCFLSGGLDSSLVAAILFKKTKELQLPYTIQTFAIGMDGSPDLIAARKVADHLQTEHHEVILTPEDGINAISEVIYHLENYDTITIRSSIAQYLLSKYIKENTDTTVVLSGEGADEIAQGYIYFHDAPSPEEGDKISRNLCEDLHLFDVLRTDRTTAAWGLEVRVPFLDHQFSSYYLSIQDILRQPQNGIEKYILRSAFDATNLLPRDILWRPKEGFSDGISTESKSWYKVLQDCISSQITDDELKEQRIIYQHNPPKTKEALYYRRLFEKFYPGKGLWVPYYWMPKWITADDPSARVLKNYKQ